MVEFGPEHPGDYDIELVLQGDFPIQRDHLPDADDLEFNNLTAHAKWTIVVRESKNAHSVFRRSWEWMKEGLAIIALVEIVSKVQKWLQNQDGMSMQADEDETDLEVTTLDEFTVDSGSSSAEAKTNNRG